MNINDEYVGEKILGMYWNINSDEFEFQTKFQKIPSDILLNKRRPTKREILSMTMSIYDPFGFLANFMIYAKVLIQELWKSGVTWDEPVPDSIYDKWTEWQSQLKNIKDFHIARCYSLNLNVKAVIELHVFVDASEAAFAAVAYWRIKFEGNIEISFICGKTRCAPQKILSIPRLELQAAILGTRLKNTILKSQNVNPNQFFMWTDSETVLAWINSSHRRYSAFVAHRIAEILDSTEITNWFWVPSKHNPADDATRAKYPPCFQIYSNWLNGPSFLKSDQHWHLQPENEMLSSQEELLNCKINFIQNGQFPIEISKYSSYIKLKRVTAWVLRFISNIKQVTKSTIKHGELTVAELSYAEKFLCRHVQSAVYGDEVELLKCGKPIKNGSSIFKLTPFFDKDGLIKVQSRISKSIYITNSMKFPIILPKDNELTKSIATFYHEKFHHQNRELVISEIRQKFWVPNIRGLINQIKSNCNRCKLDRIKPKAPLMGELPLDRLTPHIRPFSYTGLDYFGPFHVTIGRRREKRWVALFTCLSVRAVHLELANDLSTDACIICIRNFVNRRGVPVHIRCDNGTNFIGAAREMSDEAGLFDSDAVQAELASKNIEWVFNCPSNPEAGGCWERLVQSVKRVLKYTLNEVSPKEHVLISLLIEAENIVNSRPLTYLPISSEEEEPITPNHLLLGGTNSTQTPTNDAGYCFRKQWRIAQQLKNKFWKRWMQEYLPTLTRRTKWFDRINPIKVGDLVLVCDTEVSRSGWRRGRVVRVFPGADGQVRAAEVKTATGILRRPAIRLAVLDIERSGESSEKSSIHGVEDVAEQGSCQNRTNK